MSACVCPTCQRLMPETDLPLLDVNGSTIYFRGKKARVWLQKVSILHAVIRAYPGVARWDEISRAVWGSGSPASERRQLQVLMASFRQDVRHMDFVFVTHRGLGWSLRILPDSRGREPIEAAA